MKPRTIAVSALLLVILGGVGPALLAQGLEYPPLYKSLGLPELPRSRVLSSGREAESLRDGLNVRLSVLMNVEEIRRFYTDALTQAGWSVAAPRTALPGMPIANVHATKSRLTFTAAINASQSGGATQVNVTVVEK
jgi:hypothetical protein